MTRRANDRRRSDLNPREAEKVAQEQRAQPEPRTGAASKIIPQPSSRCRNAAICPE